MGFLIDTNLWIEIERGRLSAQRDTDFRVQDLWLAAQAVQRGFTVLTANGKDFQRRAWPEDSCREDRG